MYQWLKLDHAEQGDFRHIIPSRPGYLRTPLSVGRTPREPAEAFAALLDILKIDKVAVLGGSGGGPSAIGFAARYPDRCVAFVLEEAVSKQWNAGKPGFLEAAINKTVGHDFGVWLIKDQFAAGFHATNPGRRRRRSSTCRSRCFLSSASSLDRSIPPRSLRVTGNSARQRPEIDHDDFIHFADRSTLERLLKGGNS